MIVRGMREEKGGRGGHALGGQGVDDAARRKGKCVIARGMREEEGGGLLELLVYEAFSC